MSAFKPPTRKQLDAMTDDQLKQLKAFYRGMILQLRAYHDKLGEDLRRAEKLYDKL